MFIVALPDGGFGGGWGRRKGPRRALPALIARPLGGSGRLLLAVAVVLTVLADCDLAGGFRRILLGSSVKDLRYSLNIARKTD